MKGARFYTPEHFRSATVPSAVSYAQEDGTIQVEWNEYVGAWRLMPDRNQVRGRRYFALVDADGTVTPGPAFDPSFG